MATSLDFLFALIERRKLESSIFTFLTHHGAINWRQRNLSIEDKIGHLEAGLIHPEPIERFEMTGRDILARLPLEACPSDEVLSISSRFLDQRTERHLAFMNLHIDYDLTAQDIIHIVQRMHPSLGGSIFCSGRYYHIWFDATLGESEWLRFLASFLMPTFLVSPRYIGHALHRGFATLRLNAVSPHKPKTPEELFQF